jgi:hypothetical protein
MNDTSMVQTEVPNGNSLSTDNIQLQLKSVVKDEEQHSSNQTSLLPLVILPKNHDDIVVNEFI